MEIIIAVCWYIAVAIFVGIHAEKSGKSGGKYFAISLIFSPVISLLALIAHNGTCKTK